MPNSYRPAVAAEPTTMIRLHPRLRLPITERICGFGWMEFHRAIWWGSFRIRFLSFTSSCNRNPIWFRTRNGFRPVLGCMVRNRRTGRHSAWRRSVRPTICFCASAPGWTAPAAGFPIGGGCNTSVPWVAIRLLLIFQEMVSPSGRILWGD